MEALKKRRAVLRTAFTRVANQFDLVLNAEEDVVEADAVHEVLQHKIHALKAADDDVFNLLMSENASEDDLTAEINICDEYTVKYTRLRVRYQKWKSEKSEVPSGNAASSESNQSGSNIRKFSLPKIEIIKFGGELREWLPFWSQFKKIHVATDIDLEDKFQYLLQAITPGTRARELVGSYPPTAENYQKAIDSLKSRFGRDDLLVEVYVRELLKLVLNNAMSNNSRCSIATLYDKIETQLRSLETLGVNTDTCSAMLYPLVESCLPEELLRVWQRSTEFSDKPEGTLKGRLERLLRFLKKEVEDAERISLAIEGFHIDSSDNKQSRSKPKMVGQSLPTAAGLLNNNVLIKCVFCDGDHDTEKCFKAQKLSVEEKKSILMKKKACFRCAKIGHSSRKCHERLRCLVCGSQHIVLLCPELANKTNGERGKRMNSEKPIENQDSKTETGLANRTDTKVFLQTLVVKIRSEDGEREARAIIDTGSQRSYVLKRVAQELHYQPKRTETIVHALFGGAQTSEQQHTCYDVRLVSLDGEFACRFEALDQPIICNDIPSVFSGVWSEELRKAGVRLTDTKGRRPIDLLIGADIAGKIFTGKRKVLQCGLIAIETLLGWVLMGKVPGDTTSPSTTMMVTSLLNKDMQIAELWQLDVLGITDPSEKRSKAEIALATKELFNTTVSRNDDGRYEVKLPWREGHPPLPSNYEMAKKPLTSIEKRLRNNGYYKRYREVFTEWLEDNIIEEVPKEELKNPGHYLPHRPVIKEDSATTKIRPVFDASAKEKGEPSLNDCTEKGANLIELIPSILLRFREQRIGVTSDIRKAFLQISLSKNDRDFVRFLCKAEDGTEIIYRHRRVVFGINASPFLLGATIEFHLRNVSDSGETDGVELTIRKLLNGFYVDNCVTSVPNEIALINFRREATELMAMAKFDLRGWEFTGNQDSEIDTVPLLGLKWNTKSDVITIGYDSDFVIEEKITKRVILSTAERIFDPGGFSYPATLFPKSLLRPIQRLYPLECIGTSDGSSEEETSTKAVFTDEDLMMSEDRRTSTI